MTRPLANIWARRIYAGTRTIEEVSERYGAEGVEMVRESYLILFGEEI